MSTAIDSREKRWPAGIFGDAECARFGPMQRTPEWHAIKRQRDPPVFGASEAAALCGKSLYKTPLDPYLSRVKPQPLVETEDMRIGKYAEPMILNLYADDRECRVHRPLPLLFHRETSMLAASLDAIREDDGRPVEAKWSMSPYIAEQLGEEGSDWVPTDWLFQVQQQMDTTDTPIAHIAAFIFGRLRIYTIKRHDGLIRAIHDAADRMAQCIKTGTPPAIDFQHAGATDALRRAYPAVVEHRIVFGDEAAERGRRYIDLGKQIKELERQRKAYQAGVLDAMGEASHAKVPGEDLEFRRTHIAGGDVSYTRQPYVKLTHGRPK